ncbi:hypothetical protein AZSI13_12180 [Azospira sp. I13]|uniref:hypothetical protein n=1 Tax=Azospira sp. I13 TaxID=1765050 RepID=UPI000D49E5D0|nr:hypothetical protein [Azospira sp. I13]GBG01891.1 hypothetical protein AZSI13_12180 [Azospira sp. I13]
MSRHPNTRHVARDIDQQYLENIRHLRNKIVEVQANQREISHSLERIRDRIRIVVSEMQRIKLRSGLRSASCRV